MQKNLVLGYGNADRQDDGAAWHILVGLAKRFGLAVPSEPGEPFDTGNTNFDLLFMLQLYPEMAEVIKSYDCIFFVDAHTGEIEENINFSKITPHYQNSPFTHHMTPEMLLSIAETIYGGAPKAYMLSIRGYEFGFVRQLSERTRELSEQAVKLLHEELLHNIRPECAHDINI